MSEEETKRVEPVDEPIVVQDTDGYNFKQIGVPRHYEVKTLFSMGRKLLIYGHSPSSHTWIG